MYLFVTPCLCYGDQRTEFGICSPPMVQRHIFTSWCLLSFGPRQAKKCHHACAEMCAFTSSCAYARSHPGLFSPMFYFKASNKSDNGRRVMALIKLRIRCPRMPRRHISFSTALLYIYCVVVHIVRP